MFAEEVKDCDFGHAPGVMVKWKKKSGEGCQACIEGECTVVALYTFCSAPGQ